MDSLNNAIPTKCLRGYKLLELISAELQFHCSPAGVSLWSELCHLYMALTYSTMILSIQVSGWGNSSFPSKKPM